MSIELTSAAATRIGEIAEREGLRPLLRVMISGGGCQGFKYDIDLDDETFDDDILTTVDGSTLAMDPVSASMLDGAVVDWVDALVGASFEIRNPNAGSTCGCGVSFS